MKSTYGGRLESEVGLEVLRDFSNKSLEGELSDEELGRLLVSSNLSESDGTWLVSVGLLDTAGRWCGLSGCSVKLLVAFDVADIVVDSLAG